MAQTARNSESPLLRISVAQIFTAQHNRSSEYPCSEYPWIRIINLPLVEFFLLTFNGYLSGQEEKLFNIYDFRISKN